MEDESELNRKQKIYIAGAHGMVGSALVRLFKKKGFSHLLVPDKKELNLTDQMATRLFLKTHKPDVIVIAAAKVGGIYANMTYPAEFIYQNLMIACNVIHEAHMAGVSRLLFLGSTCIYPKMAPQPISEEALMCGPLEKTNEAYAVAKICGVKMCQFYREQYGRDYISAMPTNLYGLGDTYHAQNSHVIPALIRRFHEAKIHTLHEVSIWGTGLAKREFLYVDDLAEACFCLLQKYHEPSPINVGSNEEFSIREVAEMIKETIGFQGSIFSDLSKPDGTPRKKSDSSRIFSLGWQPKIRLIDGLKVCYEDFLGHANKILDADLGNYAMCEFFPSGKTRKK